MERRETNSPALKIFFRPLSAEDVMPLLGFCASLAGTGAQKFFHPHSFDAEGVSKVCKSPGLDYFCGGFWGSNMVSYGMLRGWNEGFDHPSLGLAIHPEFRGRGWANLALAHLHQVASNRGCRKIRLSVYLENDQAFRLFSRAGYQWEPTSGPRAIGWLNLAPNERRSPV